MLPIVGFKHINVTWELLLLNPFLTLYLLKTLDRGYIKEILARNGFKLKLASLVMT